MHGPADGLLAAVGTVSGLLYSAFPQPLPTSTALMAALCEGASAPEIGTATGSKTSRLLPMRPLR